MEKSAFLLPAGMHSCIPRRASQSKNVLLSFLLLFGLELGDHFLFVCLFHLQDNISIVVHVDVGFWSEEMVPFWHLLRNKKTVFSLYVGSLDRNRQLTSK